MLPTTIILNDKIIKQILYRFCQNYFITNSVFKDVDIHFHVFTSKCFLLPNVVYRLIATVIDV